MQRIDIVDVDGHNLRMSSGREGGADELEWRPGGFTSGGLPEAIIDPVNKADIQLPELGGAGDAIQYELLQRLPESTFETTVRLGQ